MKQKRLLSICMALLILLSVFTATAIPSFAADPAKMPVTVKFIDGDTGEPVAVAFSSLENTGIISFTEQFTVSDTASYTWVPSKLAQQRIIIRNVPEQYALGDDIYNYSYASGYAAKLEESGTVDLYSNNLIVFRLYKKNSPGNIRVEFRNRKSGRLIEDQNVLYRVSSQANDFMSTDSFTQFHPFATGAYQVGADFLINNASIAPMQHPQTKVIYDGQKITLAPDNTNPNAVAAGRTLSIYVETDLLFPYVPQTSSFIDISFVDAQTKEPLAVTWSLYPEDRAEVKWEVAQEYSSGKTLKPLYFKQNELDMTYYLTVESVPQGYFWRNNGTELRFEHNENGIIDGSAGGWDEVNFTADYKMSTITVAVERIPETSNIDLSFYDKDTNVPLVPDSVTVSPKGTAYWQDVFGGKASIQFIPKYYTANFYFASSYSITVRKDGYEDLVINDAFTYGGAITESKNTEFISTVNNTVTLKLKKKAPVIPTPGDNLLRNTDFEMTGLANWYQRGSNPTVMQTNSQYRSGAYSLYMAYFKNEAFNNHIDQTCFVNHSGNYKFSAYIKTDTMLTGAGAMLTLEARDTNGLLLMSSSSPAISNANGGWQQLNMQMYAPPGTASIVAKIGGIYCTGGFYVDDAELLYQS